VRAKLNPQWRKEVAARLRWARRASGLTQTTLAIDSRVSRTTIFKVEQGKRIPGLATILLWCKACGVSPYVILEGL
jgi:transcriptional regulator with XRE-family HTH domain